jgi:hypothetical protein
LLHEAAEEAQASELGKSSPREPASALFTVASDFNTTANIVPSSDIALAQEVTPSSANTKLTDIPIATSTEELNILQTAEISSPTIQEVSQSSAASKYARFRVQVMRRVRSGSTTDSPSPNTNTVFQNSSISNDNTALPLVDSPSLSASSNINNIALNTTLSTIPTSIAPTTATPTPASAPFIGDFKPHNTTHLPVSVALVPMEPATHVVKLFRIIRMTIGRDFNMVH